MVSIVSCLSGTALKGRIARKTFVGILQLIVLVSLTTKQTHAKNAVACYGGQFYPPLRCGDGLAVNVSRVTIGFGRICTHGCCPITPLCEVSVKPMEKCQGRPLDLCLRALSNWTTGATVHCADTHVSSKSDDSGTVVYAKYVKIEYNCRRVSSASPPPPSWTTTTPDEDRVSDTVTPNDVTTDSGEASGTGSASVQVGVAVGVTVAVLVVVGVITTVLVIHFLRRRRKQMERQIGKDAMASQATPVPNSYDNAFYQGVIPSAPPPTPGGTTRDPPPLDPTASSGHPHPPSPGAAQDTDYDLVRSPYAKVQRPTSQDSEYDLRLMENPTYN